MFAEGVGRMSEYPSMYDAAIEYAKKGFAVFTLIRYHLPEMDARMPRLMRLK